MMHQRMGKPEQGSRISKNGAKSFRKTLLGNSTLAIILQPNLSSSSAASQKIQTGSDRDNNCFQSSASTLFIQLKESNKIMVKGAKLHESLSELRLSGWLSPCTLLLVGPSEDMKIVKHAWIKRHLKSPQGYFIKDIGVVRDCVVEMIQQSPFMSLTTALFEAVADLNHQNIFPTKDTLYDYLRKQYPEIKTPDTKVIHDCLGRLIKNRRLYHNGRGYFILMNENILNEVIALKSSLHKQELSDTTSLEPSIMGFKTNDSRTSSSGHTEGQTDIDAAKTRGFIKNRKRHDSLSAGDTLTEVSTIADVANLSELNTPRLARTMIGSKLFRKSNKQADSKKNENSLKINSKANNNKMFSCGMMGAATESIILSNDLINSPSRVLMNPPPAYNETTILINDETASIWNGDENASTASNKKRAKVKRSKSFGGKTTKEKLQESKEVSFALVGSPNDKDSESDSTDEDTGVGRFHRSHSFGAGYSKNKFQKHQFGRLRTVPKTDDLRDRTASSSSADNTLNGTHHDDTYEDIESSFVEDSVPVFDPDYELAYDPEVHLAHHPDMVPVANTVNHEQLDNYKDLGSALSLPRLSDRGVNFNVLDLLSPTKEECLAEELKQAYHTPLSQQTSDSALGKDSESVDLKLLSPRSRRRIGAPYESQYITEVLTQSEQICQALENSKTDNNSNLISNGIFKDGRPSKENKGVKLRSRSTSTDEKKRNQQKERNSQLFEEKRSSLKVMGMV